jgi:hypothetical protein
MSRTRSKPPWAQASPSRAPGKRAIKRSASRSGRAVRRFPHLVEDMPPPAVPPDGRRRRPVTRGLIAPR